MAGRRETEVAGQLQEGVTPGLHQSLGGLNSRQEVEVNDTAAQERNAARINKIILLVKYL